MPGAQPRAAVHTKIALCQHILEYWTLPVAVHACANAEATPGPMMLCGQVAQTEGVGFYYSENIYGVPPVLIQHVQKFPVLHEVNILITNRAVPVPDVLHKERILVETLGLPGFYHCICRSAV